MLITNVKIIEAYGKRYSAENLLQSLRSLGIKQGDILCVHSQIFSLGRALLPKEEFLEELVSILKELVGNEGTLIMPTFSYSFCKNEVFDINKSSSTVGLLTEWFRKDVEVKRTHHPIFSFAVWGKMQEEYLDIGPDAFGLDSVYGKMIRDNGKILMFGANKGYTFHYLAEEHVRVPYRFFKVFEGEIVDEKGNKKYSSVPYFVRNLDIKSEFDEEKLADFLLKKHIQKQVAFGKGTLGVVKCREMYFEAISALKCNPQVFL